MKYLFFSILCCLGLHLTLPALASVPTKALGSPGSQSDSKPLELPDFSNIQTSTATEKEAVQFKTEAYCQTKDGQTFTSTSAHYETCVINNSGKPQ